MRTGILSSVRLVQCALVMMFILFHVQTVLSADVAAYYRGRTIKLVVGYGPGGGYDTLARVIAPYLEQQTGATVVVENRPGGGGLVALNQVFQGETDGLTIMLVNGQAAVLAQLLGVEGARYDLMRASWLGRVSTDRLVVLLNKETPFTTLKGMQQVGRAIKWAGGGKADTLADTAACFSEALQLNSRIIIGYKGSKEAALSAMRGETDGLVITESSASSYVQGDRLFPVVVLDRTRSPHFPEVPTVFEWATLNAEQAWWIDFRAQIASVGRALLVTPDTAAEQVDYLANVFARILQDKEFLDDAQGKGHLIDFADIGTLQGVLKETLGSAEGERLEQVRSVVLDKYYQ